MSPTDFKEILRTFPFVPFRVHVSDGRHSDVRTPELLTYSNNTLFFWREVDPGTGGFGQPTTVGLLHVTGTTPLSLLEPVAA